MKLNLNLTIKEFIDSSRGLRCRADYILRCVSYIRDNNIDINNYYEGDYINEEIRGTDKKRKSTN